MGVHACRPSQQNYDLIAREEGCLPGGRNLATTLVRFIERAGELSRNSLRGYDARTSTTLDPDDVISPDYLYSSSRLRIVTYESRWIITR